MKECIGRNEDVSDKEKVKVAENLHHGKPLTMLGPEWLIRQSQGNTRAKCTQVIIDEGEGGGCKPSQRWARCYGTSAVDSCGGWALWTGKHSPGDGQLGGMRVWWYSVWLLSGYLLR